MLDIKKLLKYELEKFKSNYFCLRYISYSFKDDKLIVQCEFGTYGFDHYNVTNKELNEDKKYLIKLLKDVFKNVETDYYDISFEIENYKDFFKRIKKEIISKYKEKWVIQILKASKSSYYDGDIGMDIEFIEKVDVETIVFDNKEDAIVEYHLMKNYYYSNDLVDIKLMKVMEE